MEKKHVWARIPACVRTFLIVALVFLAVGLGTLGSARSTGKSYVLSTQQGNDSKEPAVVLQVTQPSGSDLYVKEIYVNVGAVYAEPGETVTLHIARGTTASSAYSTYAEVIVANLYANAREDSKKAEEHAQFNWVKYTIATENGWRVSTYPFYKITALDHSVMINEIVFVGNDKEGTGDPVVLGASVHSSSILPYDRDAGESEASALLAAGALLDSQFLPSVAQSSFFRLGDEEATTMLTIAETYRGNRYESEDVYTLERVYNSFGTDLVMLGTTMFGMSPFALRFMPFLAAFGTLVLGFLFVRRLFKSDKAGLVFAILYALCGVSLSLGHLGTPLMIGVFFLTASLYFAYRFFEDGMKKANLVSALPALFAGLFAAAAICVNGAYLIPAAGVAALFAAGVIKIVKARRAELDAAIGEAEAEEAAEEAAPAATDENGEPIPPAHEGRKKIAKILSDYRFRISVSVALFVSLFVLGAFLIGVLSALPLYFTYVKLYPEYNNIFYFVWKAFAGGYAGVNPAVTQSAWSLFYVLFRGSGSVYGVTAAGLLIPIAGILAGVFGAGYAIARLARTGKDGAFTDGFVKTLILLVGIMLTLVTASFGQGGVGFLFLAALFLFAFAGDAVCAAETEEGKFGAAMKILKWVWLGVAAALFALFFVFIFSVPTAGFMAGLL